MTSTEKIIQLIDQGDPVPILAEDSLVENFNELIKHELIDIKNDKVILTSKGEEARKIGLDKVVTRLKTEEELKDFSVEIQRKEFRKFQWCCTLCLSLLAFLLAVSVTDCSLNF